MSTFSSSSRCSKRIFVSSTNKVKVQSALHAFQQKYSDIDWIAEGVSEAASEVADQPMNEETYQGCKNRAKNVLNYLIRMDFQWDVIVSIENGIFGEVPPNDQEIQPVRLLMTDEEGKGLAGMVGDTVMSKYYDTCVIKVISHTEDIRLSGTEGVPVAELIVESTERVYVNPRYVQESLESKQTKTCGSMIEKDLGIAAGTWHERFYPGRSRYEIMRDTVNSII